MFEVTVIVPVRDNAGKALTGERRKIEGELLTLAGGFSRDKIVGQWRDSATGKVYRDESYRYTTACDMVTAACIQANAADWCEWLRQEALYVSVREAVVTFAEPVKVVA
jgi:hypothetical protein